MPSKTMTKHAVERAESAFGCPFVPAAVDNYPANLVVIYAVTGNIAHGVVRRRDRRGRIRNVTTISRDITRLKPSQFRGVEGVVALNAVKPYLPFPLGTKQ